MTPVSPGSTDEHVGVHAARDARAGRRRSPQASSLDAASRQFTSCASATAAAALADAVRARRKSGSAGSDSARRPRWPRARADAVADEIAKRHGAVERESYHLTAGPALLDLPPRLVSLALLFLRSSSSLLRLLVVVAAAEDAAPEAALLLRLLDLLLACGLSADAVGAVGVPPDAPDVLARGGGRPTSVGRTRRTPTSLPKTPARRSVNEDAVERADPSSGSRAADEVLGVDHRAVFSTSPSRSTTCTLSQPPAGSLPDIRQTLRPTTLAGRSNQSGLSPRVARFMNAPQIGTASSPA